MHFRSNNSVVNSRSNRGSVMPMIAFALMFIFVFLAFSMDVMRQILEIQQIKFASIAAALDVLPFSTLDAAGHLQNSAVCTSSGSFLPQAMSQMQAELARPNGSSGTAWNFAITNPSAGQSWSTPVIFDSNNLTAAANNGTDKTDPLLQLTTIRTGSDSFRFLFLPAQYAASILAGASSVPLSAQSTSIIQSVAVSTQPALRIGPGAPLASSSPRAQVLSEARAACLPLALNYDDFKNNISNTSVPQTFTIIFCDPNSAQTNKGLRGYFMNLASGGPISSYYWDAQNPSRVNDLIGLIAYFSNANVPEPVIAPAAVERGIQIDRFTTATVANNPDFNSSITALPLNVCYIVPVVREGVSQANQCEVVGFSLLNLTATNFSNGIWTFKFATGESLPILNASSAPAYKTLPQFDGTQMPPVYDAANNPFVPRQYDPATNSFSARRAGVAMAPTVFPRRNSNN